MEFEEAVKLYSESLARHNRYFGHTITIGYGESERSFAQRCSGKNISLGAPYRAEKEIRAAGLNFKEVWEAVHECSVLNAPGMWFYNWKTGETTACWWSPWETTPGIFTPKSAVDFKWVKAMNKIALQSDGRILTDEGVEILTYK